MLQYLFLFVVLSMHLLSAHLAAAGPLIASLWEWRANRLRDLPQFDDGRRMACASLVALVLAAIFGVALGFLRYSTGARYLAVWEAFHTRIMWGVVEYLFSAAVLIVYLLTYPRQPGRNRWFAAAHRLLAIVAATNLMYHLPPLFATIADAAHTAEPEQLSGDAMLEALRSRGTFAKSLHFSVAAVFVASIWGIIAARTQDSIRTAVRVAIWSLALQWLVGFWLLTTLPSNELRGLMGGKPLHMALLIGGLLASVMALLQLFELGTAVENQRLRWRVVVTSACLLLAMIGLMV